MMMTDKDREDIETINLVENTAKSSPDNVFSRNETLAETLFTALQDGIPFSNQYALYKEGPVLTLIFYQTPPTDLGLRLAVTSKPVAINITSEIAVHLKNALQSMFP